MIPQKRVQNHVPCPAKQTTMAPPNRTDNNQGTLADEKAFIPIWWCILKYEYFPFFNFCQGKEWDIFANLQWFKMKAPQTECHVTEFVCS